MTLGAALGRNRTSLLLNHVGLNGVDLSPRQSRTAPIGSRAN
jgi:hypothetical protein